MMSPPELKSSTGPCDALNVSVQEVYHSRQKTKSSRSWYRVSASEIHLLAKNGLGSYSRNWFEA